ncbi:MAG: hypothetical protein ACLUD2_12085 [Clostridium sp.]
MARRQELFCTCRSNVAVSETTEVELGIPASTRQRTGSKIDGKPIDLKLPMRSFQTADLLCRKPGHCSFQRKILNNVSGIADCFGDAAPLTLM